MKKIILLFMALAVELLANEVIVQDILNYSLITVEGKVITVIFILKIVLIMFVGFTIGWVYKNKIINSTKMSQKISISTRTMLGSLGYYFIVFITLTIALNAAGLNLSSLAVVAGALSVGIGFGLQNIVSNFISGIILMFEKTITVGDYVELASGIRGTVREIRLRATIITTNEQIDIIVPNSDFIQNSVTNLTLNNEMLRMRIPFGVAYGTTIEQVQKAVLEEIIADETLPRVKNNDEFRPKLWMVSMGASSVDFELVIWVEGEDTKKVHGNTSMYLMKIYGLLYKYSIAIPFPQMDIHVKEVAKNV
jgi:small-conductance mechanosensitive channel